MVTAEKIAEGPIRGNGPHCEEGNHYTKQPTTKPCLDKGVDTPHAVRTPFTISTDVIPIADMDHLLSQRELPSL
jgi:hypothetical protein